MTRFIYIFRDSLGKDYKDNTMIKYYGRIYSDLQYYIFKFDIKNAQEVSTSHYTILMKDVEIFIDNSKKSSYTKDYKFYINKKFLFSTLIEVERYVIRESLCAL